MNWFYAEAGERRGPVTEEALLSLVAAGKVRDDTLVWCEGMAGWEQWSKARPASATPLTPPVNLLAPESTPTTPGAAEAAAASSTGAPASGTGVICAECGKQFQTEETVQFGSRHVCAACKPVFLQRLREGAPMPSGTGNWITEEELLQRGHSVEIGDSLGTAMQMLTNPVGVAMGTGALVAGIDLLLRLVPYLGGILTLIFGGALTGGLMLFYLRKLRGDSPDLGYAFCGFGPRFGALLGAFALPGLITGLAGGLLAAVAILPMFVLGSNGPNNTAATVFILIGIVAVVAAMLLVLFLTSRWQYTLPLVADKGYGVTDAMRLSWRLVGQNPGPQALFVIVRYAVMIAGFVALCVGLLFAMPLATCALAVQYDRMCRDLTPRG